MLSRTITGTAILLLNLTGILIIAGYCLNQLIKRWKQKVYLAGKDHSPVKKGPPKPPPPVAKTSEEDLLDDFDLSEFDELSLDDFDLE